MDIEWIQQTCRRADNRRSGLAARRTRFLLWKQRSGVVQISLVLVQADAFTTKVITITASATVHPNSGSER
jgi:hypothetical protein|tara:strand:- start:1567 stop:1779 length:213 start_codon:yes stop_codon:yes gene_type:complete